FPVQGDSAEQVPERVLESQTDDRGEDGAAGKRGLDVVIENEFQRAGQQQQVENDRHDLTQQLWSVALPRHDHIEDEGIDDAYDEDDQRDPGQELKTSIFFAEQTETNVPVCVELPAVVAQEHENAEEESAQDQRSE